MGTVFVQINRNRNSDVIVGSIFGCLVQIRSCLIDTLFAPLPVPIKGQNYGQILGTVFVQKNRNRNSDVIVGSIFGCGVLLKRASEAVGGSRGRPSRALGVLLKRAFAEALGIILKRAPEGLGGSRGGPRKPSRALGALLERASEGLGDFRRLSRKVSEGL